MMGNASCFIHRWKWVGLYTSVIYGTIYLLPWISRSMKQHGMGWVIRYGPVVLLAAISGLLLHRLLKEGGKWRKGLLLLSGTAAMYAFLIVVLAETAVERAHLIEYGLLGFLVLRAMEGRHDKVRLHLFTVVVVLVIGFVDEVIQGFLPGRIYDPKDVLINTVSGVLGLCMVGIFQATSKPFRKADLPIVYRQEKRASDIAALVALAAFFFLLWFIDHVDVHLDPLYGTWRRPDVCDGPDTLTFSRDGRFIWEDTRGHRTKGTFHLDGNRLEGTRVVFEIEQTNNDSDCGIRMLKKSRIQGGYIRVEGDRLTYGKIGPWLKEP